ncbi:MAG TPA: energy-coupling factor ABC transporter permease [Chloroflexota bacterium]|nr:energy-coupling factor ABC transporter permease [Chloroflexota bacterium]
MHIPDGVLPIWLIAAGWLLTVALLALASRSLQERVIGARLPLLGVMSALMLVAMSLELAPIGYHINLTVISGIVLGPALGFLAAFLVNLVLAFFGHGGITVVGLNTLIIGVEIVLGYYLFHGIRAIFGLRPGVIVEAGMTAVLALVCSTFLMFGIVALSNVNPGQVTHEEGAPRPSTLTFRNPVGQGALSIEPFPHEEQPGPAQGIDLFTFMRLVLGLGSVGWILEALITGLIAGYVARVRPDLMGWPSELPGGG